MKLSFGRYSLIKFFAILAGVNYGVGVAVGLFVVLVRVPALAESKRDLLFGTLDGVAVSLLFAITALLINLTFMVYQAGRSARV